MDMDHWLVVLLYHPSLHHKTTAVPAQEVFIFWVYVFVSWVYLHEA